MKINEQSIVKSDDGSGTTERTKNWVKRNIKGSKITVLFLDRHMTYKKKTGWWTVRAIDAQGFEYLLSGFEWGYGGEGPHGLLWFVNNYCDIGVYGMSAELEWTIDDVARLKGDLFKIEFYNDKQVIKKMS